MTVTNETINKEYEVLDRAGNNYLLLDRHTEQVIIALGFRDPAQGWDQGKYFGSGASAEFRAKAAFREYSSQDAYGYV